MHNPKEHLVLKAKPDSDVKEGAWYYGFTCKACKKLFAVVDSYEDHKISLNGGGQMRATCPKCRRDEPYQPAEFQHFQA